MSALFQILDQINLTIILCAQSFSNFIFETLRVSLNNFRILISKYFVIATLNFFFYRKIFVSIILISSQESNLVQSIKQQSIVVTLLENSIKLPHDSVNSFVWSV